MYLKRPYDTENNIRNTKKTKNNSQKDEEEIFNANANVYWQK